MHRIALPLLSRLLAHRRLVVGLYAALALASVPGLLRLESDNSPQVFFLRGSPEVARYGQLRGLFGSDEAVRIVATGAGLWSAEGLAWLGRVEEAAAELAGVRSARGLYGRHRREVAAWPPADPGELRRLATADLLDRQLGLVDADGTTATVLLVLERLPSPGRARLLRELAELTGAPPPGVAVGLAGLPAMDRAMDASSQEIQRRFFPLLVIFTIVLLGLTFRDPRSVAVPLAFVIAGEVLVLGMMGYAGVRLNMVLAVLPPLVFVIGLATAVHVLVRYRELLAAGVVPVKAVLETYRDKGWAVLWTGLTTLVGFGSLAVSPVGPVRSLGVWCAAAMALMTMAAFSLYPALLALWVEAPRRPHHRRLEGAARAAGRRWAESAARRRRTLLAAAAGLAVVAAAGLPKLAVESNALTYLPSDEPARASIELLEARGIGPATVEIVLTLPPPEEGGSGAEGPGADEGGEGFRGPSAVEGLVELSERLRGLEDVLGAVSAGDVLAAASKDAAGRLGGLAALAAAEADLAGALAPFLTADGRTTRLLLFTPVVGFDRLEPVKAAALAAARHLFPRARAEVTGQYPLLLETQRQLLRTLGVSLTLTFLCVAAILRWLLGTTRLTLLAVLPNLWPVLGVLGAMGWLGAPLDIATVMVASVLLGLAVDDTIHTLGHFRELAPVEGRLEAVAATLEHTAPAYVLTGVILAAGFGVCAASSFAPTARFGALSALGIALAVTGDLFLLPAILGSTPEGALRKMRRRRPPPV